jgi:hypothetical protein
VNRIAVYIPTTAGPARVERITRERAPQSMVCLKRSSTVLPISDGYDSFVRPGSGVIERAFGPFEEGAFRLDVSSPIETGESWQLGVFIAHALCAAAPDRALLSEESADTIVWASGHVDHDLAVGPVGHIAEKMHASQAAILAWRAAGRRVVLLVRAGADHDATLAAGVPDDVQVIAVNTVHEALDALHIPAPPVRLPVPKPKATRALSSSSVRLLGALATIALATFALSQFAISPTEQKPALLPSVAEDTPSRERLVPLQAIASAESQLALFERRAPEGRTCAQVQFGKAEAIKVPVAEGRSDLKGLCGLSFEVDNGGDPKFVAVDLDVLSGKLLYGTEQPERFGGQMAFAGSETWAIDLPRRMSEPFEIRVTALRAPSAIQPAAEGGQIPPGLERTTLHHRVLP